MSWRSYLNDAPACRVYALLSDSANVTWVFCSLHVNVTSIAPLLTSISEHSFNQESIHEISDVYIIMHEDIIRTAKLIGYRKSATNNKESFATTRLFHQYMLQIHKWFAKGMY